MSLSADPVTNRRAGRQEREGKARLGSARLGLAWVRETAGAANATKKRRKSYRQPAHDDFLHPLQPDELGVRLDPPIPKADGWRSTRSVPHDGHTTFVVETNTSVSKRELQSSQRYS